MRRGYWIFWEFQIDWQLPKRDRARRKSVIPHYLGFTGTDRHKCAANIIFVILKRKTGEEAVKLSFPTIKRFRFMPCDLRALIRIFPVRAT